MNLDSLNKWLLLVANVGVVVGLLFLIIEVRQNTTALNAQAYQSRSDALREMSLFIAASEDLAAIDANIIIRPDTCSEFDRRCGIVNEEYIKSLNPTEWQRYKRFLQAQLARVQNLLFQYEQGLLSEQYHQDVIDWVIEYYMPLWEIFDIFQREGLVRHLESHEAE
jgi:hypothetical protein